MADNTTHHFDCSHCGRQYRWKPQFAGRKVTCKCGHKFRVSDQPPAIVDTLEPAEQDNPLADMLADAEQNAAEPQDDIYALDIPEEGQPAPAAAATADGRCPSCNQQISPTAVICVKCGFNLKDGKKLATEVAAGAKAAKAAKAAKGDADVALPPGVSAASSVSAALSSRSDEPDHRKTEIIIPLILAGVGIALLVLNALLLADVSYYTDAALGPGMSEMTARLVVLLQSGVTFVIQMPFFFIGLILVAAIFSTSFGQLTSAILKLAAVALLTLAAGALVSSLLDAITGGFGGIGWMISVSIEFGVFFAACAKLLDMDVMEALVLYLLVMMLPMFAAVFVLGTIVAMFL